MLMGRAAPSCRVGLECINIKPVNGERTSIYLYIPGYSSINLYPCMYRLHEGSGVSDRDSQAGLESPPCQRGGLHPSHASNLPFHSTPFHLQRARPAPALSLSFCCRVWRGCGCAAGRGMLRRVGQRLKYCCDEGARRGLIQHSASPCPV